MKKLTKLLALFMCMSFVIMAITPSTVYAAASVGQVKIKSVKADKNHVPTVTWSKVKGANGYVVYRKDDDNLGDWEKIGTTKETSFKDNYAFDDIVITWFDPGFNYGYKYKVRAYVKNGKKVTYGKYSKTKAYKFTRYMYKNKLIVLTDYETDSYSFLKAELPKEFKTTNARYYGNDTLDGTVREISDNMNKAFGETEEGQALAAEYDRLEAEFVEYRDKMWDSEDETERAEYSSKCDDAYKAYREVEDKLYADGIDFLELVKNSAGTCYNNLKDSKGNTVITAEDIDRIVNEKSTSDYTGWIISVSGSSNYDVDEDYVDQTPNGVHVYYDTEEIEYSMYVNVPVDSTAKSMYKEKGAKMSNHSYNAIIGFMRFENGHRVRVENMDLNEVDEIIKGIKFTPVTLVKRYH